MDVKEFCFDVETTGLSYKRHLIVTIGLIVRINGIIEEKCQLTCKPPDNVVVEPKILELTRLTMDEINKFDQSASTYLKLDEIFNKYVNKFDSQDKFSYIGYNVSSFDIKFLNAFYKGFYDDFLFSYLGPQLDVLTLFNQYVKKHKIVVKNSKLGTACEFFKIPIKAHNSLSDATATLALYDKITNPIPF